MYLFLDSIVTEIIAILTIKNMRKRAHSLITLFSIPLVQNSCCLGFGFFFKFQRLKLWEIIYLSVLSLKLLKVLQMDDRNEGNHQSHYGISSWSATSNTCDHCEAVTTCDYSQLHLVGNHLHTNRYKIPFINIFQRAEDIKEWDFFSHLNVHKSSENVDSFTVF